MVGSALPRVSISKDLTTKIIPGITYFSTTGPYMGLATAIIKRTPPAAATRRAPSSPASGGRRRAASASTSTAPTEAWPTRACPAAACCPRSMFGAPIAASSCAQIPRSALWPAAGGVTQRCRRSARGVCACALGYRREHACRSIRCRQRDTRPGNNPQSPLHTSAAASAVIARAPMRRREYHRQRVHARTHPCD